MKKMIGWYFRDWWKIVARPIYFYTFMEKGELNDKPFSFLLITAWLLSLFITVAVYITSISQMMIALIQGIYGIKLLIVAPVFLLLVLIFFIMVFLIVLSVVVISMMASFYLAACAIHYIAVKAGGKGELKEMVRSAYYSSAPALLLILLPVLACATKFKALSFANFTAGTKIILFVIIFYLWGLWSTAVKKVYKVTRTKALSATLIVVAIMILLQMFGLHKVLSQLERWIS
ncbi:MAG: hypothetical protein NTZ10_00825 [Candidatus Saganbacteria bacterium]|nr:hypothetical protein [Candidatus Saganbacteria bacterium]